MNSKQRRKQRRARARTAMALVRALVAWIAELKRQPSIVMRHLGDE